MKLIAKRSTLAVAAAIIAALLAGGWVFAAWAGSQILPRDRGVARAFRMALARLDLSQDQKDKIKSLVAAQGPTLETLKGQRKASVATLRAALQAPQPDPATVGNALLKVRAGRQALRDEAKKLRDATAALLTSEQKAKFDAYLDAFRMMRHRRATVS